MQLKHLFPFALLNGLLWCVLSIGYFYTNGFPSDTLGWIFAGLLVTGHLFLFVWCLWLVSAPAAWIGPRTLATTATAWGSMGTLFWGLDLLVFSQYRFHISLAMLELFFGPAGREIFAFSTTMWLLVAAIILLIVGLELTFLWVARKIYLRPKICFWILACWGGIFLLYNGLYAWGKFNLVPSIVSQRAVLPFANPLSVNRRMRKWGFEPKKEPYSTPKQGTLSYPLHPLSCQLPASAQNILIILVESWRNDSVTPQIMPNLTRWIQQPQMTYFTNHLSGGNATEAGVFSLFYSMPYAYWNDFTSRKLAPVLITQALQSGYVPAIYSSGKLNSPTFHQNVFATIDNLRLESQGQTKWQRDEDAVNDFSHFLNTYQAKQPFFGFVFLDATHGSSYPEQDRVFTPAQEMNYLLLNRNTDPTPYLNQYHNSVHFVDRMIERILTDLQTRNLLKNTWVFITGDHGQEINDTHQNFWGHNGNFARYQTHVPLLVWNPSSKQSSTLQYRTNHYDIAPTILQQLYGCTNPAEDYSIGMNLFDSTPRPFSIISSYTKKAIRTDNQLTVLDAYGGIEMYDEDLKKSSGADPTAVKDALKAFSQFYN